MTKLPKNFRTDLHVRPQKIGFERRQEILDDIDSNGTYLPRGVNYEDIDKSFIKFVKEDLAITIEGEKVPVIFLTSQRWAEFTRTWKFSDEYKNIKIPFITIVRLPNPQVGTNQAGLFNIPGIRTYTYMKVPTFDGARVGVDVYKIPQPVSVDFNYEVRIFSTRIRELNNFNYKVQGAFRSIQHYVRVNGHPMPILLESIGDESNISDFEDRRFYIQPYEMKLLGYILDEDEFEVFPTVNRIFVSTEIVNNFKTRLNSLSIKADPSLGCVLYSFEFRPGGDDYYEFISGYNLKFTAIKDILNIDNIIININGVEKVNGLEILEDINVVATDRIEIIVVKNQDFAMFTLIGELN